MRNIVVGTFVGFVLAAAFLAACGGSGSGSSEATVEDLEQQVTQLQTEVAHCLDVLTHFSRSGDDVFITGANLHVVNGLGETATVNGLGNLVVGYNELRVDDGDPMTDDTNDRTGSHMLVAGRGLNYSSYGGVVCGERNTVDGPFASVTGGLANRASGAHASVTGGYRGLASGDQAAVTGGWENTAEEAYASVSGGRKNLARELCASVSGGYDNTARGECASVSGGGANEARGDYASVTGGRQNEAGGAYASVSGGESNEALGDHAAISGGYVCTASAGWSTIGGGYLREITAGTGTANHYLWRAGDLPASK